MWGRATPERPSGAAPAAPGARGRGWYRGDLHTHTHHSDARGSLDDLLRAARARGLDFVAVTDHNTTSHHGPARAASGPDLLVVPGEEITTYRGHANVWGVAGWVDFRIGGEEDVARLVRHVHDRGGLFSVNHPRSAPGCIGCDWSFAVPPGTDVFEVWNGPWAYRNWEALARCDALLREGRRLVLVGGSDRHQPGWPDDDPGFLQVGTPTTWFSLPELSEEALLAGLADGLACVAEGPDGPRLELEVDGTAMGRARTCPGRGRVEVVARVRGAAGDRLRYVAAAGVVRTVGLRSDDEVDRWSWAPDGPFLRAEVVAAAEAERGAGDEATLVAYAREHGLPFGLTVEEVLAHPRVRALSNPVYLADAPG